MRISDWSSDVCSSDLQVIAGCVETIEFRVCALLLDDKHIDAQFQQCVERGRVDFIPGIPAPVEVQLHRDSLSAGSERSEERRVGKECVSTCRSRWSPYH